MNKLSGIELCRGLAAIMVMLFHYAYLLTEERTLLNFFVTGVDLFFVISGFVFSRYLQEGITHYAAFYMRRFFRLYPLYFISLIFYFLLTGDNQDKILYFIKHLFFLGTTASLEEAYFFNIPYWTLPVEIEFYLLIPVIAWLFKKRPSIVAFVIIAFFTCVLLSIYKETTPVNIFYTASVHLPGYILEFLIGAGVYQLTLSPKVTANRHGLSLLLLLMFVGSFWYLSHSMITQTVSYSQLDHLGIFRLLCALSYGALLGVLALQSPLIEKLPNKLVLGIGGISYPLYLFHLGVLTAIHKTLPTLQSSNLFLFAFFLSLFVAYILHKLIEKPFIELAKRLVYKQSQ